MNKILNFITKKSAQYMPEIMEAQAKSNTIMAKNSVQAAMHGLAAVAMLGAAPLASAAGFEADAKDMANKIYKGIYGFVGVVALIVVLWQCVEGDATHEITSHLHKIISSKIYFTICNFITKTKTANAPTSSHLLFPFSGYLKSIQLAT